MRREQKSPNDFKFGIFIGRFPSGGAANMTVKGLSGRLFLHNFVRLDTFCMLPFFKRNRESDNCRN